MRFDRVKQNLFLSYSMEMKSIFFLKKANQFPEPTEKKSSIFIF